MSVRKGSYFQSAAYQGERVGRYRKSLVLTACMSMKRRKQVAILKFVADFLKKTDKVGYVDSINAINHIALPLLKEIGYAEWLRDVITDMSIAIGIEKGEAFPEQPTDTDTESTE